MFGDYEFLSKMYGLSGANGKLKRHSKHKNSPYCIGKHSCLWCHITSTEMQLEPVAVTPSEDSLSVEGQTTRIPSSHRTLETLQRDHRDFVQKGGGNLKKAKDYNVISIPFFAIPIDQVTN